jgi:hypothetical protein
VSAEWCISMPDGPELSEKINNQRRLKTVEHLCQFSVLEICFVQV